MSSKFLARTRSTFCLLLLAALFVAAPSCALAQAFGEVTGTTTDPSHAVIPGATLRLENEKTGTFVTTKSSRDGNFVLSSLLPGSYKLVASAAGFADQTAVGIIVDVARSTRVDLTLHVSSVNEQVVVTSQSNTLDLDNGYKGQLIEQKEIADLPLESRNPLSLMTLTPGVQSALGNSATNRGGSDSSVASSGYQVNGGIRSNFGGFSEFLVDGISMTDPRDGTIMALPSAGTVQEFSVQSGVMSAEFGETTGGVINYVTKSGTSQLHGMLFEDYRGTRLNAYPSLPYNTSKPLNNYNQYGGNVGGPVWIPKLYDGRKKSFFFVDYEGLRWAARSNSTGTVPTPLMRQGNFSELSTTIYDPNSNATAGSRTPFANQTIDPSRISAFGKAVLALYPLPNLPGVSNNYRGLSRNYQTTDVFTVRGDQYLGQRHRISFKYTRDEYNSPTTGAIGPNDSGTQNVHIPTRTLTGSYNFTISPKLLYTAVAGYTYFHRTFLDPSNNTVGPSYFGYSVVPTPVSGSANDVRPIASITLEQGLGTGVPQDRKTTVKELSQIVSLTEGKHFIRAGADIRQYIASGLVTSGDPTGSFGFSQLQTSNGSSTTGNALASALLGLPNTILFDQEPNASASFLTSAFFVADDWKVSPTLTLNMGFRYQYTLGMREKHDLIPWFDDTSTNTVVGLPGVVQYTSLNGNPGTFSSGDMFQLAPRLAFAYSPAYFHSATVWRGGIGVYNGPFPNYGYYSSAPGLNSLYNPTKPNATAPAAAMQSTYMLSSAGGPQGEAAGLGTSISTVIDRRMKSPRTVQWNFGVQQQFPAALKFELQYSGNRGVHLLIQQGIDLPSQSVVNAAIAAEAAAGGKPGTASAYLNTAVANPLSGKVPGTLGAATVTREVASDAYPQFSGVTGLLGNRDSIYHSLQATLQRRASKSLTLLASYTFSKLLTNDTPGSFASQSNTGSLQNPYNLRDARAVSDFDSTHIFAGTALYMLPFGRDQKFFTHGFMNAVAGGFQLATIVKAQTGVPIAVTQSTANGLGVGSARPDKVGDPTSNRHTLPSGTRQWINAAAYSIADGHYGSAPIRDGQLRGPNFVNADISLQRTFPLFERATLQFRAEAFNAFNHTNLAMPNSDAASASFGQITSSYDPRNIQLSLHLDF